MSRVLSCGGLRKPFSHTPLNVGIGVGAALGLGVGTMLGLGVGGGVGSRVGTEVGVRVGTGVGMTQAALLQGSVSVVSGQDPTTGPMAVRVRVLVPSPQVTEHPEKPDHSEYVQEPQEPEHGPLVQPRLSVAGAHLLLSKYDGHSIVRMRVTVPSSHVALHGVQLLHSPTVHSGCPVGGGVGPPLVGGGDGHTCVGQLYVMRQSLVSSSVPVP